MSIEITQSQPIQARPRLHVSKPIKNCLGRQYTVEDDLWVNVVTITEEGLIGCSCGLDEAFITCSHIEVVEEAEKHYIEQAERRNKFVELFNIYG